jgi:pimeloyl-ACP methyl ester carboxylesterase
MNIRLTHFFPLTLLTFAVVTSGSVVNGATPDRAKFGAAWKSEDCATFKLSAIVAAISDCGYVTVPEHHRKPNGRTLELAVVRTRSIGKNPAPDPILLGQGGPGDSAISTFPTGGLINLPQFPALLESRDLVTVEQRGTLYSRPYLNCPEKTAHTIAVAKGERKPTDSAWMLACRDRFLAKGVNFNAFNSIENAADFYFVAEVLGYKQFNYFGGSYGSLLGQYIVAQAKDHKVQLRSAIIDGVVRPDIDFNLASSQTISQSFRKLFADCAQDRQCDRAFPNLETVLLSLVDRLNQKPVPMTLNVPETKKTIAIKLDGEKLLDALVPLLYSSKLNRFVPSRIYQAKNNDFSWVKENLSGDLAPDPISQGMYHAILCARTNSIRVLPASIFPEPYKQTIFFGLRESESVQQFCKLLRVELEKPFVAQNMNIPSLVLEGAYDPVTPQEYGKAVASNLKTDYFYTFPGIGHVVLSAPPDMPAHSCAAKIVLDFLAAPNQAPDSSCLKQVKPIFVYK